MGYSHYWERKRKLPLRLFQLAAADCRRLCQSLSIPLGGADGEGRPLFSSRQICFNGHAHSASKLPLQQIPGLLWPSQGAQGLALPAQADPRSGGWGAGTTVSSRVLGSNGEGSYETFLIERVQPRSPGSHPADDDWAFGSCKTNFRPYDLCVQACLIILQHHLGSSLFRVSSDGSSRQWDEAREACQRLLGFGQNWGQGKLAAAAAGEGALRL